MAELLVTKRLVSYNSLAICNLRDRSNLFPDFKGVARKILKVKEGGEPRRGHDFNDLFSVFSSLSYALARFIAEKHIETMREKDD